MTTIVASVDLDSHGRVHEAACLAHMDRWRFRAGKSNAYDAEWGPMEGNCRPFLAQVKGLRT